MQIEKKPTALLRISLAGYSLFLLLLLPAVWFLRPSIPTGYAIGLRLEARADVGLLMTDLPLERYLSPTEWHTIKIFHQGEATYERFALLRKMPPEDGRLIYEVQLPPRSGLARADSLTGFIYLRQPIRQSFGGYILN